VAGRRWLGWGDDGWWREAVSRQNRKIVLRFVFATFFDRGKKEQSQKLMSWHHDGKQSLGNIPFTPGGRLVE
jgi:hypothetical protein